MCLLLLWHECRYLDHQGSKFTVNVCHLSLFRILIQLCFFSFSPNRLVFTIMYDIIIFISTFFALLQTKSMALCPYDPNHEVPETSLKQHTAVCHLRKKGLSAHDVVSVQISGCGATCLPSCLTQGQCVITVNHWIMNVCIHVLYVCLRMCVSVCVSVCVCVLHVVC